MRFHARTLAVFGAALAIRVLVVGWAYDRFPASGDGAYYHVLASRLAAGLGYTWQWPDGVVTYAAHYPVGYPAILAVAYLLFGAAPSVAMLVNAVLGAAGAAAAHVLLVRASSPRLALFGGLGVAIHPALVPYTPALMTEGVTAALLVVAAACATDDPRARAGGRRARFVTMGCVLGIATLVRPQSLVVAPLLGFLSLTEGGLRARVLRAALATVIAALVCLPWTVRNCRRMDRCTFVSANGGWNLAIGTQTTDGSFRELVVPEACREVFAEAAKDACFGEAALRVIAKDPFAWIARVPRKLGVTFEYFGAAPWYLHAANPASFDARAKAALGTLETAASRLLLVAALVAVARLPGPRRRARLAVGIVSAVVGIVVATVGYLGCVVAIALLGGRALLRGPVLLPTTAFVVLVTAATHAVFFGAGRYGLVVVPFVTALAFVRGPPAMSRADGGEINALIRRFTLVVARLLGVRKV